MRVREFAAVDQLEVGDIRLVLLTRDPGRLGRSDLRSSVGCRSWKLGLFSGVEESPVQLSRAAFGQRV